LEYIFNVTPLRFSKYSLTIVKKIIIIDPSLDGGIAHYTFALCNALAAAGSQVSLVTQPGTYELSKLKRSFEIVPLLQPEPRRDSLPQKIVGKLNAKIHPNYWCESLGKQVGQYIQSQKVQIVHQQWTTNPETEPIFWAAMSRQFPGRLPLVYTAHNVLPHESSAELADKYRNLYLHPERIVVHGEKLRQQMIQEAAVPEQKLRVIPLGNYHHIAEAAPLVPQSEARARLELSSHCRVILFLGAIRSYKGLDVLLLAFERLLHRHSGISYKLLVAGRLWGNEKWDQSLYGGLCRSLKITDFVQVHQGYIPLSDFGLYFGAADIACFPYRSASQSAALQLAYSYRKPVIGTSVGSLSEVVVEGQTGRVVRPEEPDELADALQALLSDPVKCRQMGDYAYQWARDEYSWENIAQRTLDMYGEMETGGRRKHTP
jgi:D-inositol-3-phosphate glycosyltransferase